MRYGWFVCALTLLSCGGLSQNVCRTACGMVVTGAPWSCSEVRRVERLALEKFAETADKRLYSCYALENYHVDVQRVEKWKQRPDAGFVSGETFCEFRAIKIGSEETAYKSSLAHEMAHALQQCVPLPPREDEDYYHSNWVRDGIRRAVDFVEAQ